MKKTLKSFGMLLLVGCLAIASCSKDDDTTTPNNGNNSGNGSASTIAKANIGNGTYGSWGTTNGIDFDKDGKLEYRISSGELENGDLDFSENYGTGTNIATIGGPYPTEGWDQIKAIPEGTEINSSTNFGAEGDAYILQSSGNSQYVGLRIGIGGKTYYGWARATISGSTVTWVEAYYNTTANAAIKAGQTK